MVDYKQIRERAGVSRAKAAVAAGVSEPTARAFELGGPDVIRDRAKAASLSRVYASFAAELPKAA